MSNIQKPSKLSTTYKTETAGAAHRAGHLKTHKRRRSGRGHTVIHPNLERLGAIVLTAVSVLVSFETIVEHQDKFSHHDDHDQKNASQVFARSETKGETARLPEEFDIGLQAPHVSGL